MNININENTLLKIGTENEYYKIIFKDQLNTYTHIIKGSKFEILHFLIKNCNIYNLRQILPNKFNSKNKFIEFVLDIIEKQNKTKRFSNLFFFANGSYNYIHHEFEKIKIKKNEKKKERKNICLLM